MALGGDGAWCLVAAAFASLLVTPKLRPSRVAVATFIACWAFPIAALAAPYGRDVALEAAGHAVLSLPADAVWLAARFGAIYAVVSLLWRARLALHGRRPVARVEAKAG